MSQPVAVQRGGHRPGCRRRRTWRDRYLIYAASALSAAMLLAFPVARYIGGNRYPQAAETGEAPAIEGELLVSEAVIAGAGPDRHIAGGLRNVSARAYGGVQLIFAVRDGEGKFLGTAAARIPAVNAGGTARFATGSIPESAATVQLRDINGSPRPGSKFDPSPRGR